MPRTKIKGKIIRILDKQTVIINLGSEDGIDTRTIFYILGEPEPVIDPDTKEELGRVHVAKKKVKASQVFDKFTIATTTWVDRVRVNSYLSAFFDTLDPASVREVTKSEGDLIVDPKDLQPWKAKTEVPVKIGNEVEALIDVDDEDALPLDEDESENSDEQDEPATQDAGTPEP